MRLSDEQFARNVHAQLGAPITGRSGPPTASVAPSSPPRGRHSEAAGPLVWRPGEGRQVWLLAVGVEHYARPSLPTLEHACDDARRVRDWFVDSAGARVQEANVRLLYDEHATRANVMRGVNWLREHAKPGDLVVLYFAVRGAAAISPDKTRTDAMYLALYDTNPSDLFATALPLDELCRRLDLVEAKVDLIVLEASFATPINRKAAAEIPRGRPSIRPEHIASMRKEKRRVLLAACSGSQSAMRPSEIRGGLFTALLLRTLGDGRRKLIGDCFSGVSEGLRRVSSRTGSRQDPLRLGSSSVDIVFRTD